MAGFYDAEFERDGEPAVRDNVARRRYVDPGKMGAAQDWLRRFDSAISEASQAEQISISRSAKDAAWEAARAANSANMRANIAIGISIIATIAATVAAVCAVIALGRV